MEQKPDKEFPYLGRQEKMLVVQTAEHQEILMEFTPWGDIALDRDLDPCVDLADFNIEGPPDGYGLWVWEGTVSWSPSQPDPDPPEPHYEGKWRRPTKEEMACIAAGNRLWPGAECVSCKRCARGTDLKTWRAIPADDDLVLWYCGAPDCTRTMGDDFFEQHGSN